MALTAYQKTALTGGGADALDGIDGNTLNDGDFAFCFVSGSLYVYILDADSGASESAPGVIAPDANPGDKRWLLQDLVPGASLYDTLFIPAGAMAPLDTNGAAPGSYEYAANDIMIDYFAFDGANEEYVAFSAVMPGTWDRSTIKARFYWAPGDAACSAGDKVEWEIAAAALSDDDPIDAAPGTGQVISDTVLAGKEGDLHVTGPTPALTVGGSPALRDLVHFKVSRNTGSAGDDMTEDAWLFGVLIQFRRNLAVSAW